MGLHRFGTALAALALCAVMAGCATSRSEIKLPSTSATTPAQATPASARTVYIRAVKDARVFEQAPREASTPSLGLEGSNAATDEVKARAVARKRNGFGQALGDVLLEKGSTVSGLVRESLATAFTQAGYRVVGDDQASTAVVTVDVQIDQFWAWFHPGFWAITLNANIQTRLDVAGGRPPVTIKVHTEGARMAATDGAWMETIEKARAAFVAEAVARLKAEPL